MNNNRILQRFAQLDGYALLENTEAIVDENSARIFFRQTSAAVRGTRGCMGTVVVIVGLSEIIMISTMLPLFAWLLIPFAVVGFLGVDWYQKQIVINDEKTVYLEIDTRTQIIPLPIDTARSQKYTELHINEIRDFYAWEETDEGTNHSLRCIYGKEELVVLLHSDTQVRIEQYARLMGFVCAKDVWKRTVSGKILPMKNDANYLPFR